MQRSVFRPSGAGSREWPSVFWVPTSGQNLWKGAPNDSLFTWFLNTSSAVALAAGIARNWRVIAEIRCNRACLTSLHQTMTSTSWVKTLPPKCPSSRKMISVNRRPRTKVVPLNEALCTSNMFWGRRHSACRVPRGWASETDKQAVRQAAYNSRKTDGRQPKEG